MSYRAYGCFPLEIITVTHRDIVHNYSSLYWHQTLRLTLQKLQGTPNNLWLKMLCYAKTLSVYKCETF